ncbi:MAG: alpha-glucosidase family protein [Pseudomonadota bacterium]
MSFLDPASSVEPQDLSATDADWWRGAVIYQIYPRSYQDSNGDGIGDLAGIIQRLPHIASLGVDGIWVSPFFTSPMLDFGYDVSNYRDIDPMFGTLGDFDALVRRAHELGMKVLIDLVLSHTSDQHPWFRESRQSRGNAKSDWYVWADPKPDGTPPNNWLSIFGGSAWEWEGERMQYYLHNFLIEQPDLNFHNAEVQDELLAVARYWLERGVDGFRLDTVNFYVHDKELRDNPALTEEQKRSSIAPAVNPYTWQNHLYDKTQPENIDFLRRLRGVMDEFPAITAVGEVGDDQRGLETQAAYTAGDDLLHMCYGFDFLSGARPGGDRVAEVLTRFGNVATEGWACWAFSNHDVVRHPSRWSLDEDAVHLFAALLLSLKGTVCLYQGEELGLTEAYVAYEDLQDPYGKRFWPKFKGRDGARTPMPWVTDNRTGGFSDGKPWLPMAVEHLEKSVANQDRAAGSTLAFYRDMIAFRKDNPALIKGALEIIEARPEVISFVRTHEDERIFCAFNMTADAATVTMPDGNWQNIVGSPFGPASLNRTITLDGWQAAFAAQET